MRRDALISDCFPYPRLPLLESQNCKKEFPTALPASSAEGLLNIFYDSCISAVCTVHSGNSVMSGRLAQPADCNWNNISEHP